MRPSKADGQYAEDAEDAEIGRRGRKDFAEDAKESRKLQEDLGFPFASSANPLRPLRKVPASAFYRASWVNGQLELAFTSPSENDVWMSFTFGRLISTCRANWENASRSRETTCSSKVPAPLM